MYINLFAQPFERGNVYHSESLIKFLDENDIYYKTGENYLNNLPEYNRTILLENDPMLPFSIIVDKKEFDELKNSSFQNVFLRQLVPVSTYDKLDISLEEANKKTDSNEKYSFISAYEPQIFLDSQREIYLTNLKGEIEKISEKKHHFKSEVQKIRDGREKVKRFTYDEKFEKALLAELEYCRRSIEMTSETKLRLTEESGKLNEEISKLTNEIKDTEEKIAQIKQQLYSLMEFKEKNNQYMQDYKDSSRHQSVTDILNSIDTLNISHAGYETVYYYFEELVKKRESLSKYLGFYEQQLQNIEHTKRQVINQCISYARIICDDIVRIAEKSRVKLSSSNKTVRMLKIDIPDRTDDSAESRMEDYMSV